MGDSVHRLRTLAVVVAVAGVATACSGSGGGGSSERTSEVLPSLDVSGRCDLGLNTAAFNDAAARAQQHDHEQMDMPMDDDMAMSSDDDASGATMAAEMANPSGHVDFTLEDWAAAFADEDLGLDVDGVVEAVSADDLYRRHVLAGVLTHTLRPDPWAPMTDRAQCDALADQLRTSREVAARYPTVADAKAAGYTLGDDYHAGLGVHYQNWNLAGPFDPNHPLELLYDGIQPDAELVGLSYVVLPSGDDPPEGYVGDNDHWHRHRNFCLDVDRDAYNIAADILSPDECAVLGGTFTPNRSWMLHTWVVPGCESDWGVFSAANPRLPYLPEGVTFASGCNSGDTVADPLELDGRGDGPDVS
jgi:hypothetical protein